MGSKLFFIYYKNLNGQEIVLRIKKYLIGKNTYKNFKKKIMN